VTEEAAVVLEDEPDRRDSGHQLRGLKNPISPVPSMISPSGLSSGRGGSRRPVNST
jgi:hypothetical protein